MRTGDHETPSDATGGGQHPPGSGVKSRRTAEPTLQVSLRLPASQVTALRELALNASRQEQRMITPQEIVRRMIVKALQTQDAGDPAATR
jgi:hypothetical protein